MSADSITDRFWFTGDDKPVTFSAIAESIEDKVVIGTDSHRQGSRKRVFATAICMDPSASGRNFFWTRRALRKKDVPNLHTQLFIEAQQSIDVAEALLEQSPYLIRSDIVIHIDVSPETSRHKSGRSATAVSNLVRAYGFDVVIKPTTSEDPIPWAASAVGDNKAR